MSSIEVELIKPSALSDAQRDAWNAYLDADARLASPYFCLEFAECCEEARDDTRVISIKRKGQQAGFLPLQAGKFGYARPLAGPLGDVHGLIAEPGIDLDLGEILHAAHIPVFAFHSALTAQGNFAPHIAETIPSWLIDLTEGFEAWKSGRKALKPKVIKNVNMRYRRLDTIEGGHRFVMMDNDPQSLALMLEWKSQQYRQAGFFDTFSVDWTRRLISAILKRQSDRFAGLCSSLRVNEEIVAVHIGMASDRLCHYWFPAYNRDYSKISPGLLLLVEMAKTAAAIGHLGVELGPGDYGFKNELSNAQIGIGAGVVTTPTLLGSSCSAVRGFVHRGHPGRGDETPGLPLRMIRKLDRLAGFYTL